MRWNAEKLSEIYKMFISMYTQQMLICMRCSRLRQQRQTRWTFFRVKLVFECDLVISWSFRPFDLGSLGLLELFPPPPSPHTSSYLHLSLPPNSSYLLLRPPALILPPFTSFYLLLLPLTSFYLLLPPGLVLGG